MFLQVCVCPGGGAIPSCIAGGIPACLAAGLGGGIPACLAGFQVHTQGGGSLGGSGRGVLCSGGGGGDPSVMATAGGGTHPTGLHSC